MNTPQDHRDASRWEGLAEVLRLALPIMAASVSWTLMQFVDTAMVSRLGKEPLAAVGSAGLWSFTMGTFILGVVGCVSTFVAQSLGRGRPDDCARYAWQGVYISLVAGLLALLLWPLSRPLFETMPHPPEVVRLEVLYFRIRLVGYVFMAWQVALGSFFQAVNQPRIPMYIAMLANALNVILDYLLIFGKFGFPRWEVAGAAVATVIAMGFQVGLLQGVFLSRSLHATYGTRRAKAIDPAKLAELLRIGWPAGLTFLLDVANWGIFTSYIVGYFGANALAAHTAAVTLMHMSFLPAVGLNQAVAPIVGRWIGRGDIAKAKARTYTAMKVGMVYMSAMGVIFAVFGRPLIRTFFSDDPAVIATGHALLIMAAIFQAFDAINITVSGALRGAGDTRWMACVTAIGAYTVFLPCALVLAFTFQWGAVGAWAGATVYVIGASGILFHRFHGERWRHIRIFAADRLAPERAPVPRSAPDPET